jgi:N,N'-diacetyllegionaminate synthase
MDFRTLIRLDRCFVIAEAGVNHNRDLELAMRLVHAAKDAGADAIKFQTWVTEEVITPDAPMAGYQKQNIGADQGQFAMAKDLELSFDEFREISEYAHGAGILFFSTPDDEKSTDFLDSIGVPIFKIGSAEVTNIPFLKYVAEKGKPVILSTGMAGLGEVEQGVRAIESTGNREVALLHCVSSYPADPADCNLRAMETLAAAFGYPVGFSDHTLGIEVAIGAVARGARILEKHLTLDKGLPGPDHVASLDVPEFTRMVRAVRTVESALGNGVKWPVEAEFETRKVVRRSVVARRDIPAGSVLRVEDLALRRTSQGLPPSALEELIGRQLRESVRENTAIRMEMVS